MQNECSVRTLASVVGLDFLEGKIKGGSRFGNLVLHINRADRAILDQHVHMVQASP
jgi:hypothetical protein